ncbi:MAG: CPBP family intramembrane glutamic endopeptidase [Acidobacteriota bacterium]
MSTFLEPLLLLSYFVIYPLIGWLTFERQRRAIREGRSSRWLLYGEIFLVEWVATAAVAGIWISSQLSSSALGLDWPSGERATLAWSLAMVALAALATQVATGRKSAGWRQQMRDELAPVDALMPTRSREMAGFAALSLTAGFCEEVLFRGFLFWWLQSLGLNVAFAAVGTVVVFGLAHSYQGPKGLLRATAAGAVLIALVLLAGSLWPAILLHMGMDLIGGWTALAAHSKKPDDEGSIAAGQPHAA